MRWYWNNLETNSKKTLKNQDLKKSPVMPVNKLFYINDPDCTRENSAQLYYLTMVIFQKRALESSKDKTDPLLYDFKNFRERDTAKMI